MPSVWRLIVLGGLVLPLFDGAAFADWQTPLAGAPVPLPSRFVPMHFVVTSTSPSETAAETVDAAKPIQPSLDRPFRFALPLVDRHLSPAQKAAPLDDALQEAILRIEPLYDSTRLDGPDAEYGLHVSSGTATMDDVFADHWHAASADPNINRRVPYIAMAWQHTGALACDAFLKNRMHQVGDPALTTLTSIDCASLSSRQTVGLDEMPTLAPAHNSVPVFAAPLPGSRLSSQDFWSAQRARIAAIQANLHRKWEPIGLRNARAEPDP